MKEFEKLILGNLQETVIAPALMRVASVSVAHPNAVREIGNIGAHMEKDINVIVDVESDEAKILIEMLEILFEEWYIARHERDSKLSRIQQIRDHKKAIKVQ